MKWHLTWLSLFRQSCCFDGWGCEVPSRLSPVLHVQVGVGWENGHTWQGEQTLLQQVLWQVSRKKHRILKEKRWCILLRLCLHIFFSLLFSPTYNLWKGYNWDKINILNTYFGLSKSFLCLFICLGLFQKLIKQNKKMIQSKEQVFYF